MTKPGLDATDIRILSAVQQYGQLSKSRLAEMVNLSPTPCWARLTRLREAGYILGYHADIALNRVVDYTHVVVTISLTHHRKVDFDRFEAWVNGKDEITQCVATGGGMDYVMYAFTPSLAAFQDLMEDMLAADIAIDRYMTYIVTRRIKLQPPNVAKLIARGAN